MSIRSYVRYIIVYINFTSLFFVASSILILYPYLLAITAHSSSVYAIVVNIIGIKVSIRVVISLKKLRLKSKVNIYIYIYPINKSIVLKYYKQFLIKIWSFRQSNILIVKLIHSLKL